MKWPLPKGELNYTLQSIINRFLFLPIFRIQEEPFVCTVSSELCFLKTKAWVYLLKSRHAYDKCSLAFPVSSGAARHVKGYLSTAFKIRNVQSISWRSVKLPFKRVNPNNFGLFSVHYLPRRNYLPFKSRENYQKATSRLNLCSSMPQLSV